MEAIAEINGLKEKLHRVAPSKVEEEQKEKAESIRLESFRFSMCNLKEGDVIEFKYDRNITCVVKNDKKVIYEGEEYWYYNGERLCDLREKIQSKGGNN